MVLAQANTLLKMYAFSPILIVLANINASPPTWELIVTVFAKINKFPSTGVSMFTVSWNKYSSPSFMVRVCWFSLIGFTWSVVVASTLTSFSAFTIGASNEMISKAIKLIILILCFLTDVVYFIYT